MASIEVIKGSDGSGNANVATVQNIRSPGASTVIVDTVVGINPDGFIGSMGTPHTFTDPITSEVITVISEATAVDFSGHIDGSNIEIDDIAPGYSDLGSAVGDIIIIRPTTQWADEVAEILEVVHNDDGTLKDEIITTDIIDDGSITGAKLSTVSGELGGAWQSWTPTLTNLSGGILNYAKSTKVGKTIKCRFRYTLGGAGISGTPRISLPFNSHADLNSSASMPLMNGQLIDADGFVWIPLLAFASVSAVDLFYVSTNSQLAGINSTSPITWASGDSIMLNFEYESA